MGYVFLYMRNKQMLLWISEFDTKSLNVSRNFGSYISAIIVCEVALTAGGITFLKCWDDDKKYFFVTQLFNRNTTIFSFPVILFVINISTQLIIVFQAGSLLIILEIDNLIYMYKKNIVEKRFNYKISNESYQKYIDKHLKKSLWLYQKIKL